MKIRYVTVLLWVLLPFLTCSMDEAVTDQKTCDGTKKCHVCTPKKPNPFEPCKVKGLSHEEQLACYAEVFNKIESGYLSVNEQRREEAIAYAASLRETLLK